MTLDFAIRSSALPVNAKVASFRGSEELSRPYVFDVFIHVPGDHEIDLEDAVGSKAKLSFDDGNDYQASVNGIFAAFELVRALPDHALYAARIVPLLWSLSLTKHSRIFTKLSIPDVIKAVLGDEGISDYEFRLSGSYEPEEHVCQYRESSLDFIHRWMEREGMYYFFEQTDDGEKLVIVDSFAKHDRVKLGPVRYHPTNGSDVTAARSFDNFAARAASLPQKIKLADYDYTKPALNVTGSAPVSDNGFGEVHDSGSGSRFFSPGAGSRIAQIRAEELRAEGAIYHATGAALGISVGFRFMLELHPRAKLNKEYLATRVEHFGFVASMASAWGSLVPHDFDSTYRIDVTAISADMQYRHPSRTAWPRIDGYENALVDGAQTSDYAQIDEHGRYAVKFKFDEGTLKDGKASTYVRMMQPHAGSIEGWHFPQRKDTEVVVIFLGGDPDRPVIAGAIPNATTPSPVTSGNHTKNVIQTGGRNRLEIEDQSGQQRITLSTPHSNTYLRMGAPNDDHELIATTEARGLWNTGTSTDFTIGNFWHITVGADKSETVTGDVVETYNSDKTESVTSGTVLELYENHMNLISEESFRGVVGETTDVLVGEWNLTNYAKTDHKHLTGYEITVTGGEMHTQVTGGEYNLEAHTGMKITTTGNKEEKTTANVEWTVGGDFEVTAVGKAKVESSSFHVNVEGPQINFIKGLEMHTVLGVFTDVAAVLRIEGSLIKNAHALVSNEENAHKAEMHALEEEIGGLTSSVKGLRHRAHNAEVRLGALTSATSGMKSEISELNNNMAFLFNYL